MGTLGHDRHKGIAIGAALALGLAGALSGCGPTVATSDSGTGAGGNCAAGSGNVSFEECVQPLIEQESCASCHSLPSIPMDLLDPITGPSDLEDNYDEIYARAGAGDDSLLLLYLWDGPRNPDPSHPVVFSDIDADPTALMLREWIGCPRLHAGDPCEKPPVTATNAVEYVLATCNPTMASTLTFEKCVEPLLTYWGQVGTGVGCIACHDAEVNRTDVRNFHIIPNDYTAPLTSLTNINYAEVTNYSNDDPANARRLDTVANALNPENNLFLFEAFHQVFNNCLFGQQMILAISYNNANGLPAGTHPNTAFACDYTNSSEGWVEAESLAEIWYYWALNGAPIR